MASDEGVRKFNPLQFCREILELTENTTDENDISLFIQHYSAVQASDYEKRSAADQAFREYLREKLIFQKDSSHCDLLIQVAINCSKQGVTTPVLPIVLLSDIFDSSTMDICEDLFHIVEKHVSVWTSESFFTAGKNWLLRMCNDLLRRLSTSQNTIFCGRIQLILTRLFPLSEKSGLNLMSHFNDENVTIFEYKGKIDQEKSDSKTGESEIVDFIFYNKFWALQEFFRCPPQCYEEIPWKRFVDNSSAVLQAFASHKIEHVSKKRRHSITETNDVVMSDGVEEQTYFAKFLTSEKLLNLQLNDSNFRRTILVQLLILFQYLNGDVKFKSTNQVLKEKQSIYVKETSTKVYELLKETPPDGTKFAKYVECALSREENWISWKNAGCPSFIKERETSSKSPTKSGKRNAKSKIPATLTSSKIDMGSPELTRLWNLCPDNMSACRSTDRMYMPNLKDYFEESIEQADPEAQIEDQYKLVNDPKFGWRALRLLSRRSQHFFQPSTNPFKTLPQYLDTAIKQLAPEILPLRTEETIVENGSPTTKEEEGEKSTPAQQQL